MYTLNPKSPTETRSLSKFLVYAVPLRQHTHCSRTKEPQDKLEILSKALLSEKVLELREGEYNGCTRKVHLSTEKKKKRGEKKIQKK